MSGLLVLLLGLAAGALIALSPDIALPATLLLLPGLLALVLDRTPGCGVARAILLFQAAACVRPLVNSWYRCAGIDGCMGYLADWHTILRSWLAAAAAWLVTQILPLGLKAADDYRLRSRRSTLLAKRQALVAEWGLEEDESR
ncbi:hypothetical protein [Rhodopila sp.]|uniref:hypothetical protein n=1 Tax=Rhodopila sp. TaxID=2480087 RepID=UPI003D12BCE1